MMVPDAYDLDIPDEVMEHPVITSLADAANDFVAWTNVWTRSLITGRKAYI